MFTQDDIDDFARAQLDDARANGCDCDPEVWIANASGLALMARLDHEEDCPLLRTP